jgi:hypothetical protein
LDFFWEDGLQDGVPQNARDSVKKDQEP